jgi:hypothetical protein
MTQSQIDDLARSIAAEAAAAPVSPARAAAAIVRHRFAGASEGDREAIRKRAAEYLRPSRMGPEPDWLTLSEAAVRLRTTPKALKRAFRNAAGRRAYGWPRWRSNRWWIARQVVDSNLAPGYFASLPEFEPWPPECLPSWVPRERPRA